MATAGFAETISDKVGDIAAVGGARRGCSAVLRDFWAVLNSDQRRLLYGLFAVVIVNAVFEFFGLGVVFALSLSILLPNGEAGGRPLIAHSVGVGALASRVGPKGLALGVIGIFFAKGLVGVFTNWTRARVVCLQNEIFSERLMRRYFAKGWPFFLRASAAELKGHISDDCNEISHNYINNCAIFATEGCVSIALFIGLTIISPTAMIVMASFTVLIIVTLNTILKRHMRRFGTRAWDNKLKARRTVEVAVQAIKEVMLYHREDYFAARLTHNLRTEGKAATIAITLMDSPRQIIDFFAVSAFMGFLLYESSAGATTASVGVVASVFATAAYRLLPAVNRLSYSMSAINNTYPIFERLRPDLALPLEGETIGVGDSITFHQSIELRDLSFRYAGAGKDTLRRISVRIRRGQVVGLVGRSGAGKSTLMGLLVGLLAATQGEILVDGQPLTPARRRAWQDKIAYVPQTIALSDDTVANNIAFGIVPSEIDQALVRRCAHMAGIAEFIETELPERYDTLVGDEGVRLSGGQRQRVAIARALYRGADILIFDEATSAQDGVTEAVINQAIAALAGDATIVIVAHRLSSIRHCDNILVLDHGQLVQQGGFDELAVQPGCFQSLLRPLAPSGEGDVYS